MATRSAFQHLWANVLGRSWTFVATLLFVPVYVHLLGVAGFGVIALFIAISGIITFLDLGLSPTLATELANQRRTAQQKINLLFTYETVYLVIVASVVILALLLPERAFVLVVSAEDLLNPEVAASVRLVFIAAAAQLGFNFYVAGLLAAEEQVKGNVIIVAAGIARSALVIIPLWMYPQPVTYLWWQIIFSTVFALIARSTLYRAVTAGASIRHTHDWKAALANLTFTGGMFIVSVTAAFNTQIDKLFVGKLVGIEALGEYTLVSSVANLLVFVVSPISVTLLPRLVRSVSLDDQETVRRLFVLMFKLVAIVVCAAVGCMVIFGPYLVSVWSLGAAKVESVSRYMPALVAGCGFLALGTVPHAVAVANRRLKASLYIALTLPVTLPAYWFSIDRFGPSGAAGTWLVLQALVVPLYFAWVARHFVRGARLGRLFAMAVMVLLPLSLGISAAGSLWVQEGAALYLNIALIGFAAALSLGVCALLALRREDVNLLTAAPKYQAVNGCSHD